MKNQKNFTITENSNHRIKLNISEEHYKLNEITIDELLSYYVMEMEESGEFFYIDELKKNNLEEEERYSLLSWSILEEKTIVIDEITFSVDSELAEEKAIEFYILASFDLNMFIDIVESSGFSIEKRNEPEAVITKNKVIEDMNWKRFFIYNICLSFWNNELYFAPLANDNSIDFNNIKPFVLLPKDKEYECLEKINYFFGTSFELSKFQNDISTITIQLPRIQRTIKNLEENSVINEDELQSLLEDGTLLLESNTTSNIVKVERFEMDGSFRIQVFKPFSELQQNESILTDASRLIHSKWIDFDSDTEEFETSVTDYIFEQ